MPGQGKRHERVGALLLGVHDEPGGPLRYAGRVGSGFSEGELDRLAKLLAPLERRDSPFVPGATKPPRGALFCEPTLVAEVEFSEWTSDGSLRHPVYKGLREDKPAAEVVREQAAPETATPAAADTQAGVPTIAIHELNVKSAETNIEGRKLKLSNLSKVLYPSAKFTKRELIDYYLAVAPVLLGHLAGRALTVTRWPDGVEGSSFFQKQAPAHRPAWVRTAALASSSKSIDYTLAEDLPTLVWLANLAAIELHTPLALASSPQRPTVLVFDLDPGAPATILECCHVALLLQGMFEQLGLEAFAKTSGSKGLQVYVPLNSEDVSFAQTKPFAKTVAALLEGAQPELIVSRMTKTRRTGKVLIDWSQNDAKKTTICAYSLRATERPTVSAPVSWDEVRATLDSGDPASLAFEAAQVVERVAERGDLFAPVLSLVQQLPTSG